MALLDEIAGDGIKVTHEIGKIEPETKRVIFIILGFFALVQTVKLIKFLNYGKEKKGVRS